MWFYVSLVAALAIWYRSSGNLASWKDFNPGKVYKYLINPHELLFLLFDKGTDAFTYSRLCYNQIGLKFPKFSNKIQDKPKSMPKINKILFTNSDKVIDQTKDLPFPRPLLIKVSQATSFRLEVYYELCGDPTNHEFIMVFGLDEAHEIENLLQSRSEPFTHHIALPEWDDIIIDGQTVTDTEYEQVRTSLLKYAGPNGDFYKSVCGEEKFSKGWLVDPKIRPETTIKIYDTLGSLLHSF